MKIKFVARKYDLTEDVKDRFRRKLSKLDKYFPTETEATVALFEEKVGERVEITIYRGATIFRAEQTEKDVACALDCAMEILERQIRKNRTRLEKQKKIREENFGPEESADEDTLTISKVKQFEILPMTVQEAVLQMNLLSHTFYLFRNAETGVLNVVYRRKENDYGVIEPKE